AHSFAENFYFQCAATRASKRVSENIKKASREAKKAERMDMTFYCHRTVIAGHGSTCCAARNVEIKASSS
ncbi:MAG: hypothetical protein OIF58_11560, partial [Cohaesibacter sp.]|nr:hypothetical protein [Cohaesibacter sp.]